MTESQGAGGGGGGSFRKFFNHTIGGIQDKLQTGSSTFYPITPLAEDIAKEGWLKKQGGAFRSWHRRWFKLQNDYLHYYTDRGETKHQGVIWLLGNNVVEHAMNATKPDEFLFEIVPGVDKTKLTQNNDTYLMCACTDAERRAWVTVLKRVMFAHKGGAIFGSPISSTLQHEIRLRGPRKIPEIVEMCADFIIENGLETEGIFRLPGRASLIRELKDRFDTGARPALTSGEHDVPTVASLLKQYLRDLPQPLVPFCFYERVMKVVNREMPLDPDAGTVLLQELMSEIPHHSYNLLQYLCRLLSQITEQQDVNKMTPMNLATVFVHCVIRPEDDDPALLMGTANSRTQCTFFFILKHELIFSRDYPLGESTAVADLLSIAGSDQAADGDLGQSPPQNSSPQNGGYSDHNGSHSSPGEDGSCHVPNLESATADDLLGFTDNHFSPTAPLPNPLTPHAVESEHTLNRRGSRKGRVFNPDLNFGDKDDDFEHAEYIDSDLLSHHVRISPDRQDSDCYPGYESITNLSQKQTLSEGNHSQAQHQHTTSRTGPSETHQEEYSLLTNYSSNPPNRPKELLDSDDYSYLPDTRPVLRKKPSLDSSIDAKQSANHRHTPRPASSPPRPPPKPRPRTSLAKSRSPSRDSSEADTNSLYSLPFDSISESSRQVEIREAASELLSVDTTQLATHDDCLSHIQQLQRVLSDQSRQLSLLATDSARDKTRYESELRAKDTQIADLQTQLNREIEEKNSAIAVERKATQDAVERVMTLQGELQRYISRHGSLVEDD